MGAYAWAFLLWVLALVMAALIWNRLRSGYPVTRKSRQFVAGGIVPACDERQIVSGPGPEIVGWQYNPYRLMGIDWAAAGSLERCVCVMVDSAGQQILQVQGDGDAGED